MKGGFTLLELLVALAILQIGLLGTAALFLQAQRALIRAEATTRGILEAELVADSLARAGETGGGSLNTDWGEVVWTPAVDDVGGLVVLAVAASVADTVYSSRVLVPSSEPSGGGESGRGGLP